MDRSTCGGLFFFFSFFYRIISMHKESLKRKFIHNFFKLLFFSVYSEAYLNESLEFIRN